MTSRDWVAIAATGNAGGADRRARRSRPRPAGGRRRAARPSASIRSGGPSATPAPRQQRHPGAERRARGGPGRRRARRHRPRPSRSAPDHRDRRRRPRPARRRPGRPATSPPAADDRARTSARADATTVVPAPPFTDQQEISTRPPQDTPAGAQNQGPGEAVTATTARGPARALAALRWTHGRASRRCGVRQAEQRRG